jgi:WD40 repeat protein
MKISSFLMFFAVFSWLTAGQDLHTQTINRKLIAAIPSANSYNDAYSIKYDRKTGAWIYANYDTTSRKYTLITKNGNSQEFSFAMQYNSLFDAEGNVYTVANSNVSDTVFRYYFVKNNEIAAEYDYIAEGWAVNDGKIYYAAKSEGKVQLIVYDTRTGEFTKGKAYDEIRLASIPVSYSEGEPVGYVGFTKTGKPFYIAAEGDDVFLVIGADEQKHYSDISWYEVEFDASDTPCYIAKSFGKFETSHGGVMMVQGTNEYRKFDYIYGPIEFDKSNKLIYVGQDSIGAFKYRSTLMSANTAIKTTDGSIYSYLFSPSGKLAYVLAPDSTDKKGEAVYINRLVYDGKESKSYSSVTNIKFSPGGAHTYIASDKKNKYFIVQDNEVISEKFDYISDYRYLADNVFSYVGTKYGNYDKKETDKYYVFVGEEKFGPYDLVSTAEWKTYAMVQGDRSGDYAFIAGNNTVKDGYNYKYSVYTNKWTSGKFDNISDLRIINNKICYFAGNQLTKEEYIYTYRLFVDNKQLGDEYSAFTDINVSESGVMTFIASKGNEMYFVEVKP